MCGGGAFALKFEGRKRWHDADALMADIVAKRLVRYLARARYIVMKRPPLGGHSGDWPGIWAEGLVARFDHSEGYKLFSLMRASLVVKRHSAPA